MRQCNDQLYNDQKNIVVVTNFLVIAKQIVQLQRTLSVYSTVFISIYSEYFRIFKGATFLLERYEIQFIYFFL